jgi:hypothetical protein
MLNCLILCGQTVLALLALGLVGGWVLCVFRRPDRPYLWLAAPLAGIATLGGTMMGLYFGCGMRLAPALLLGSALWSAATLFCLRRAQIALPDPRSLRIGLVGAVLLCAWGTISSNIHSIRAGEPNIAVIRGSDMFGYSMCAHWLTDHPASEPPRWHEPLEGLQYSNLHYEGSRHTTFLMTAAAGLFRGLPPIYAYDWWTGVVLCAAAMGLVGLFASEPLGFLLLMAVAVTSAWLPTARSGYLGKITAYPECLLLTFLFIETWRRPSLVRILCCLTVAPGIAYSINPVLPVLVLALALGGVIAALIFDAVFKPAPDPTPDLASASGEDFPKGAWAALRAVGLYLLIAIPPYLAHELLFMHGTPDYLLPWGIVIPVSLDLDQATMQIGVTRRLIASGIFVSLMLALLLAGGLRRRSEARVHLMAIGLVPLALILRNTALYGFMGLLYPLTMAGAAILLGQQLRGPGANRKAAMMTFTVACTGAILHVPPMLQSLELYVTVDPRLVLLPSQWETDALRQRIGDDTVDVALLNQVDMMSIVDQLACRGTRTNLRSPSWQMTLKDWIGPNYSIGQPPKAKYSLVPAGMRVPRECVCLRTRSLQLCDDEKAVSIVSVNRSMYLTTDLQNCPHICLGVEPIEVVLHNGTGAPVAATFAADIDVAPPESIAGPMLNYQCGEQIRSIPLTAAGTQLRVPLTLVPGTQSVTFVVAGSADRASMTPSTPLPVGTRMLVLGNFHLDAEQPLRIVP